MAEPIFKKGTGTSRHICHHARRTERREGAKFRQMIRDGRTVDEQLEILRDIRPGDSLREKARLA